MVNLLICNNETRGRETFSTLPCRRQGTAKKRVCVWGGDYKRHLQPPAPPRAEALELKTKPLGGSDAVVTDTAFVSCRHVPIQPQMTMTW